MEIEAREFEILYETKINDRRKRIYTDMNKMYVGQIKSQFLSVTLEISV